MVSVNWAMERWSLSELVTSFYILHDPPCILANVSGQVQRIGMIGVFVSVSLPAKNRRIVQTHVDKKLMFGHLPHRTFTKCSACQQVHTPWLLCLFLPCFSSFFFRWQLKLLWKLDQTAETDSNDIKSQDAYANFGRAAFNLCFGVEQRCSDPWRKLRAILDHFWTINAIYWQYHAIACH